MNIRNFAYLLSPPETGQYARASSWLGISRELHLSFFPQDKTVSEWFAHTNAATDLFDIVVGRNLHFDQTRQRGVVCFT